MTWTAVFNIYNEIDHIHHALLAFRGKVDRILVVDGAYGYYPYKHSDVEFKYHSTDGTIDTVGKLISSMQKTQLDIVTVDKPWESETEKKNYAMKNYENKEGDYFIFVDGHEILEGDFIKQKRIIEKEEWEIGRIIVYDPQYRKKAELCESFHYDTIGQWRILRWHEDLHLKKKHWNFVVHKIPLVKALPVKSGDCEHISLAHFIRNPKREQIRNIHKKAFGKYQWNEESYLGIRRLHNVEDGRVEL